LRWLWRRSVLSCTEVQARAAFVPIDIVASSSLRSSLCLTFATVVQDVSPPLKLTTLNLTEINEATSGGLLAIVVGGMLLSLRSSLPSFAPRPISPPSRSLSPDSVNFTEPVKPSNATALIRAMSKFPSMVSLSSMTSKL